MTRRAALIGTVALCGASYLLVVALTDVPLWQTTVPPGKERRAAVAIRDDVPFGQCVGRRGLLRQYAG